MRYLKRQTLDRRSANNTTLYSDATRANVYVSPVGQGSLVLPTGPTGNQPSSPVVGMMRYDTTLDQVMVYQSGTWRALRFKESSGVTQQNLGAGDGTTVYFGPLSPAPPATVQSGTTWGPQNILVVVENVLQLSGLNYTVQQNPTIGAETYLGYLSYAATSGVITLYFNSDVYVTGGSWTSTTATLTFATKTQTPFAIGSTITVSGIAPSAYNGAYTVTGSTTGSVSYTLASNPGTYLNGGEIIATGAYPAVYPAVTLNGATVSASIAGSGGSLYFNNAGASATINLSGNIAGTTMTVSTATGTIIPGMKLTGSSVTAGTYITSQASGTTGSAGVYNLNQSASSTGTSITGTVTANTEYLVSSNGITIGAPNSAGAFTAECFVYWTAVPTGITAIWGSTAQATGGAFTLGVTNATTIALDSSGVSQITFTVPTMTTGVWYHIAVSRDANSNITVFLNGTRSSTGSVTSSQNFAGASSYIGNFGNGGPAWNPTGMYLTNLRVVTGQNVYDPTASTITVPSTPLASISSLNIGGGTVGTIAGTGPWTAVITGITSTAGLAVGNSITATAGVGTLYGGSPTKVVITGLTANTINYTVTGGTTPTAGTVTSITANYNTRLLMTVASSGAYLTDTTGGGTITQAGVTGYVTYNSNYNPSSVSLSTTVSNYVVDSNTGALVSITLNPSGPSGTLPVNSTITIVENTQVISSNGYYLKFSSPVPYGKTVIALIGFDS
jgi:hypothetical protein